MYYLNKIVWFFLNPVVVPLVATIVGAVLLARASVCWRRVGGVLVALSVAVLWFGSTMTCVCLLGLPLEKPYLAFQSVETLPSAEAIVVLGGSVGKCEKMVYPDLFESADRLWHAARLWKHGKAPKVVVSGSNELNAAVPALLDLGVPREAILVDNESRNTYENSRYTARVLGEGKSILLVTSAWHMTRALGNFSRTSLKVVPAACDFSANNTYHGARHFWDWVAPSADALARSNYLVKEWLGRMARR